MTERESDRCNQRESKEVVPLRLFVCLCVRDTHIVTFENTDGGNRDRCR